MSSQPLAARTQPLDIFATISDDLRHVEAALEDALGTRDEMLAEVSTYLLRAGGKRIRPALILLTSRFPNAQLQRITPVAVAIELIHMATLVHDDVVDKATVRRGMPTVNAKWSNQVSVLTGDYLFAKAFAILAGTGDPRVVEIMADVVYEMSRGELAQINSYFQVDQTEEQYYQRIGQKTGYLLAECCRLGGLVGGADEDQVQALYNYGMGFGLSFQIADDLLDFQGNASKVGKPVCGDLKTGILTLPVLHALRQSPDANELRAMIATRNISDTEIVRVKEILEAAGSYAFARQKALAHLSAAVRELDRIPELETGAGLKVLADFVINRQF